MVLHCNDSDTALRALLAAYPAVHDIEISAGNLEDAFLELTATTRQEAPDDHRRPTPRRRRHVGMTVRYALISTRAAYRNLRFLVLTVALPLLLFLLYANIYQGQSTDSGLSVRPT